MKRFIKLFLSNRYIYLVAIILLAVSCHNDEIKPSQTQIKDFMQKQDMGFFGYGGFLFRYNPSNCQISFNSKRKQIRIQNDNQANYLNIVLGQFPTTVNENVHVELRYKGPGDELLYSGKMKVVKITSSMIWLWNSTNNTGTILPVCR